MSYQQTIKDATAFIMSQSNEAKKEPRSVSMLFLAVQSTYGLGDTFTRKTLKKIMCNDKELIITGDNLHKVSNNVL
jgi:hypothetical protein